MNHAPAYPGNRLLSALPPGEMVVLAPHLAPVTLIQGQSLYEPGQPISHVFFLDRGFASILLDTGVRRGGVQADMIGREGVVGLPVLLADNIRAYSSVVMQTPGSAAAVLAATLQTMWDRLPTLHRACLQAAAVQLAQLEQSVLCIARHSLRERLARWLLMADDRIDTRSLPLTQESLSAMLAVGRSTVNVAVTELQGAGIVRGRRGHVAVFDRARLQAQACSCYRRTEDHVASVIPFRRGPKPGGLLRADSPEPAST